MKKEFLFCLVLFTGINGFSQSLPETVWGPEKGGFGFYLSFMKDGSFEFAYSGEGGGQKVTGYYEQEGSRVTLKITKRYLDGYLPGYLLKNDVLNCVIEETDSVFSKYRMTSQTGLELFCHTYKPERGEERMLDGMAVDSFFAGRNKIKVNARLRKGPGLDYDFLLFEVLSVEYGVEVLKVIAAVPAGTEVLVVARGKNKDIIDSRENYWYYCRFDNIYWEMTYGWIWGELIDFK